MKRELLLGLVLSASAFPSDIGGPVMGHVMEPSAQAVRPILGVPGAALFGGRVPLEIDARASVLSAHRGFLVAAAPGGGLSVVDLRGEAPAARAIEGALAGAERLALSPGGGTAAVMAGGILQIITGLPDEPSPAGTVAAANAGAFAVSDDGTVLFEAGGTLFAAAPDGDPRPTPFAGQASLIAFIESTRDALVAGSGDNEVALVRGVLGEPSYRRLAGAGEGIDQPVGLAFSGGKALVASAGSGSVTAIDVETGAAATTSCGCSVAALERMRGAALFRVSDPGAGPLWLFDAAEARFLFVPAAAEEVRQ